LNLAFLIGIINNIITYSPYSSYYVTRTSANGSAVSLSRDTDGNHVYCTAIVVVVALNRSNSTSTQPIWKRLYPNRSKNLRFANIIFIFYFAFLIDIIDNIITYSPYYVTITSANDSAVSLWYRRKSCDQYTALPLPEVIVT